MDYRCRLSTVWVELLIDSDGSRSSRFGETIRSVDEDPGSAQAQTLLNELRGHVTDISRKLEAAEERNRLAHLRGIRRRDPMAGVWRRELGEARRLIEGLHQRFPAVTSTG